MGGEGILVPMGKWGEKVRHLESYWSLANLFWTAALGGGSLMVGWFTAARAWGEGIIKPYGTLGYVATILAVALLLSLVFYLVAVARSRWIAPRSENPQTDPSEAVSEPRRESRVIPDPNFRISYGDEGTYLGAHETLMLFVVEHLLPSCEAQTYLIDKIIEIAVGKNEIAVWAEDGFRNSSKLGDFKKGYDAVSGLTDSPPTFVPFQTMIDGVDLVEKNYWMLCNKGKRVAQETGLDPVSHPELFPRWEDWRKKHNDLIDAYDRIKRDSRFGKLFRPAKKSRWGDVIAPAPAPSPSAKPARPEPLGIGLGTPPKTRHD